MTTPQGSINGAINPFKELRESHEITVDLMAKKIGISKQALIRLEQGCYVEPLPTALNYCASAFPVTEYQLTIDYEAFQQLKRQQANRYFGDIESKLSGAHVIHPMRVLRGTTNPTQVAKDLCIPPATLTYFERNVVQQKSVPKVILNVLKEIGYKHAEIDLLTKSYECFRTSVVAGRIREGKRVDYGYARRA